jgi:hypothetical protein
MRKIRKKRSAIDKEEGRSGRGGRKVPFLESQDVPGLSQTIGLI